MFDDGKPVGVVGAKKETEGQNSTVHETQTEGYSKAKLKWVKDNKPLPFLYEATGVLPRFTDIGTWSDRMSDWLMTRPGCHALPDA